jgi:hypothetical protein
MRGSAKRECDRALGAPRSTLAMASACRVDDPLARLPGPETADFGG